MIISKSDIGTRYYSGELSTKVKLTNVQTHDDVVDINTAKPTKGNQILFFDLETPYLNDRGELVVAWIMNYKEDHDFSSVLKKNYES